MVLMLREMGRNLKNLKKMNWNSLWSVPSLTLLDLDQGTYEVVNRDKFDIVPKKEYVKEEISRLTDQIKAIEKRKENIIRLWDNEIAEIEKQIAELKK